MASSDIVIRAHNLSKNYRIYDKPHHRLLQDIFRKRVYYRSFSALSDISLEIREGETVGIVGRNGSGKSTLLQIICGTLAPTSGTVEVNGRIAALLELGAGFNLEFTGRENAYLNAAILGLSKAEVDERFESIERFAEIGEFMDRPIKTYSSGMFVRLAFSVAIHVEPKVLIVDEALAVGDARFQAKCLDAIKRIRERGTTILFVSHDVASVRALCDRAIWLDKGVVRLQGDAFPVTARYTQFLFDGDTADVPDAPGSTTEDLLSEERDTSALDVEKDGPTISDLSIGESPGPINHWGTHIGVIRSAGIYDVEGKLKNVFIEREKLFIKIRISVPVKAMRDSLSVAFSIKNLRGNDLVVSATWDQRTVDFPVGTDEFEVVFEFENCLNAGNYLLVAAVEDRAGAGIQYYEYIEGAQYFSTLFKAKYCGTFVPRVEQYLNHSTGGSVVL